MRAWATSNEKTGVVAFRIDANPPDKTVSPQKIRANGIRLLSTPMPANDHQRAMLSWGTGCRAAAGRSPSATAASPTLIRTTVSGGTEATATLAKKNDPPQSKREQGEQAPIGRAHPVSRIAWSAVGI